MLNLKQTKNQTITQNLTAGGIGWRGGAQLTLLGNNTFSGRIVVRNGIVQVGNGGIIGNTPQRLATDTHPDKGYICAGGAGKFVFYNAGSTAHKVISNLFYGGGYIEFRGSGNGTGWYRMDETLDQWDSGNELLLTDALIELSTNNASIPFGTFTLNGESTIRVDELNIGNAAIINAEVGWYDPSVGRNRGQYWLNGWLMPAATIVCNAATLNLEADDYSLIYLFNVISGPTKLKFTGLNVTWYLTANNDYEGDTTIDIGSTVFIGGETVTTPDNTSGSFGLSDVINNGQVSFFRTDDAPVHQNIVGTGLITIETGGANFSGINTCNGFTIIRENAHAIYSNRLSLYNGIYTNLNTDFTSDENTFVRILLDGVNGFTDANIQTLTATNIGCIRELQLWNDDNKTITFNLVGSKPLGKYGTGILTLSGAKTNSGTWRVLQGVLFADNNASYGTGQIILDGGTLDDTKNGRAYANPINVISGTIRSGGTTTNLATFNGNITGSGVLNKEDTGLLRLSGTASTFTGTINANAGSLQIGNASIMNTVGTVNIASGVVFGALSAMTMNGSGAINFANNGVLSNAGLATINNPVNSTGTIFASANANSVITNLHTVNLIGYTNNPALVLRCPTGSDAITGVLTGYVGSGSNKGASGGITFSTNNNQVAKTCRFSCGTNRAYRYTNYIRLNGTNQEIAGISNEYCTGAKYDANNRGSIQNGSNTTPSTLTIGEMATQSWSDAGASFKAILNGGTAVLNVVKKGIYTQTFNSDTRVQFTGFLEIQSGNILPTLFLQLFIRIG